MFARISSTSYAAVQQYFPQYSPPPPTKPKKVQFIHSGGFQRSCDFWETTPIEMVHTEQSMESISERHGNVYQRAPSQAFTG
ncbi:hypothetical protein CRUP_035969 [Coryphaenoides rupestris]|nr:hypothetical protein CRUP_035969 [Coryphaenoides rupestris]